jgi:hypothetical protein
VSSASSIDPDILAAFNGTAPTASSHSNIDPDIQEAFGEKSGAKESSNKDTSYFAKSPYLASLRAVGENALSSVGGMAGSLADAVTGADFGTHNWAYRPRTAEGQALAGVAGKAGKAVTDTAADTAADVIGSMGGNTAAASQTLRERIPEALGAVGAVGALGGLARGITGAPEGSVSAQDAVNAAYARQSGGAAAVAPDVTGVSPELRAAIQEAGPNIDPQTLSRHLEADSLPVPVKLTAGQATQDPVQLSQEMNSRAKFPELSQRYTEQNQALIENLDEIRRTTAPDAVGNDPVQNGQALLDKYKVYDAPINAQVSANYKALADANGGDLPVDGVSFTDAADAALKKQMKAPFLPSGVRSILNSVKDDGQMTYENFENLRTTLAAEARKADRAGDGNAAAAVNITRNALEQLPMNETAAPIKALADTARQSAKARFDAIDADPAYKAAVNDDTPVGEQSPLADDFVKKYVIGGKKANLDLMKQKFASDPEATGTIQASALNYLKSKAGIDPYTNTGNFSQAGYNKARAELEPRIDSLLDPATADQVRTLGNVARYTQAQPRGSFVNNSNTFTAMAAEHAKGAAEQMVNYAAKGVPVGTWVRRAAQNRSATQQVNDALKPGAGLESQ